MTRALVLIAILAAIGCGTDAPPGSDAEPMAASPASADAGTAQSADTSLVRDTLFAGETFDLVTAYDSVGIGGLDRSVPLERMTFEDVPVPFTTHAYADWTVKVDQSAEGTMVWFSTDEPGPQFVGLQIMMPPMPPEPTEGPSPESLRRTVQWYVGEDRARDLEPLPSWALAGAEAVNDDHYVVATILRREDQLIHIVRAFPRRGGHRFRAASDTILSRLRWMDDGTRL